MKALALLLLVGCGGNRFNVVNDGAVLPVEVVGNPDDGIAVFVEGGPGGASLLRRGAGLGLEWEDTVEQRIAVAYYDQRGAGNALGKGARGKDIMTVHAQDLEAVIDAVRLRYDPPTVLLISHSYGGRLALHGLAEQEVDVDGWVNFAGSMTNKAVVVNGARLDLMHDVAAEQIAAGDDDPFWQEVVDFAESHDAVERDSKAETKMFELGMELHDRLLGKPDRVPLGRALLLALWSEYSTFDGLVRQSRTTKETQAAAEDADARPLLAHVDVPTLQVVGELDLVVPRGIVEELAPVEVLPGGHYALWDEAEAFEDLVVDFAGL